MWVGFNSIVASRSLCQQPRHEALAHLQIVLDGMTDQHAPLGHVRDVLLHFLEGGRCQGNPKQNKKTARKKKRNKNKKPALKEENW